MEEISNIFGGGQGGFGGGQGGFGGGQGGSGGGDLPGFSQSPWGRLAEVGIDDYGEVFGGGATDGGATDGGATDGGATDGGATDGGATDGGATDGGTPVNPFAGDNFWNIFAGGVNPEQIAGGGATQGGFGGGDAVGGESGISGDELLSGGTGNQNADVEQLTSDLSMMVSQDMGSDTLSFGMRASIDEFLTSTLSSAGISTFPNMGSDMSMGTDLASM